MLLMSMDEILNGFRNGELFTPDSIAACEHYVSEVGTPLVPQGERPSVVLLE